MVTITTKSAVEIGGIVHPGGKPFDVEDSVAEALKAGGVKFVAVAKTSVQNATQKEAVGSEGTVTTEEPVVSAKNTSGKKK